MSLPGTLLVAIVGGSVGSGLAIAGGLASQSRQHRFERAQWRRERMETAALRFGEIAARAQRLLVETSWGDENEGQKQAGERVAECGRIADDVADAIPLIHLAFGEPSPVTQSAIAISTTVRQCYVQLLYFGRIQDAESQDAWEKVREEFDELTSALSAERDSFTEEARVAVFPGAAPRVRRSRPIAIASRLTVVLPMARANEPA